MLVERPIRFLEAVVQVLVAYMTTAQGFLDVLQPTHTDLGLLAGVSEVRGSTMACQALHLEEDAFRCLIERHPTPVHLDQMGCL